MGEHIFMHLRLHIRNLQAFNKAKFHIFFYLKIIFFEKFLVSLMLQADNVNQIQLMHSLKKYFNATPTKTKTKTKKTKKKRIITREYLNYLHYFNKKTIHYFTKLVTISLFERNNN